MFNIRINCILFELCLARKTKKKEKKKERNKINKIEIFVFELQWLRDVVCKIFVLRCFVFLGAAPTLYVQTAILNLPDL